MKKDNHDDFDGFMINVFFDEDGDYLAHLVELPNVSAFGPTPAEALTELRTAWQLVKESYQAAGEPVPQAPSREGYEGPHNVPVDAQLYHALVDEAAKAGMSLYALVMQKLATRTPIDDGRSHLRKPLPSH
ncbi:MAG: toxin-antitoxin system HicB family antitoxin [Candidatus Poribacteria bacterium]|nr:toxin-antitoxin system HicB family antitoxin [Candidatus Poribacteria bacterium]MDE0398106.1 toxin-antitoxin system HicB family antitoxin [Candidatus Poribacteria bacterium]